MHLSSQVDVLKNILNNLKKENKFEIVDLINSKRIQLKMGIRIFINGEWLGLTFKPLELYEYFKKCRRIG
jgi:ASC-1-like (ASCH) protein